MKATIQGIEVVGTPLEMKEFLTSSPQEAVVPVEKIKRIKQVKTLKHKKKFKKCKKKNGCKLWSKSDTKSLNKLVGLGYNVKELAKELGRTKIAIRRKMKVSGLKLVKKSEKRNWNKWTDTERDTIFREMTNGNNLKGIAKLLGRTEGSVYLEMKSKGYKLANGFLIKDEKVAQQ